jgi:hypothetical protein
VMHVASLNPACNAYEWTSQNVGEAPRIERLRF